MLQHLPNLFLATVTTTVQTSCQCMVRNTSTPMMAINLQNTQMLDLMIRLTTPGLPYQASIELTIR